MSVPRVGGLATVAFFRKGQDVFLVSHQGGAEAAPTRSLRRANEIYGSEMRATVAAAVALGGQLGGKRLISHFGNIAAAGALIQAPPRAPVILALIGSSRVPVYQPSASCRAERVLSAANSADAPIAKRLPFIQPKVSVASTIAKYSGGRQNTQ